MWKDFFYFTKTERQGIIVLVVLIIGVYTIPALLQAFSGPEKTDPAEQEKSEKEYKVEVAAPGMTKEDFTIHLGEDGELVISMEKKNEVKEEDKKNKRYLRREFSYAKFQQALVLPDDVEKDKISANVSDGVLNITLPKRTPEEKAKVNRVIEIQ
jgi:HSP20 family protein